MAFLPPKPGEASYLPREKRQGKGEGKKGPKMKRRREMVSKKGREKEDSEWRGLN